MPEWYATRESVKRTLRQFDPELDEVIDRALAAASREIDQLVYGDVTAGFIPQTQTRNFRWPQRDGRVHVVHLDAPLLSVSSLTKEGDDATAIAAADYLLEPANFGPPYDRIEIDLSSTEFFANKDTPQRAIRVAGDWGFNDDTVSAGTLAEALDASETEVDVSDGSLIGIGDTILVESERMFVTDKSTIDSTTDINGALTADRSEVTVSVDDGTQIAKGEVIQIDSEDMLVTEVTGNDLTVVRGYNNTLIASHSDNTSVFVYATLTVERGAAGSTAATHDNAKAISKYRVPEDVQNLALAKALYFLIQSKGGWIGTAGAGESTIELRGNAIKSLERCVTRAHRWHSFGAV